MTLNLTSDLGNLFSSSHQHDEYVLAAS